VNIEQRLVEVRADKKKDAVRDILRHEEFRNAIIFSNRKTTVRELATSLKRSGFAVGQIQGDMDQSDRIAEFDRFKKDEIKVLVASDVAARGLDVKGVSHVINFDVPWQPDDYVHRIGRTGRAGMTGIAITLATREDAEAVSRIEKLIGHKIPRAGAGAVLPEAAAAQPEAEGREPREAREPRQPREPRPSRSRSRAKAPQAATDDRPAVAAAEPAEKPARAERPARKPAARRAEERRPEPLDDQAERPTPVVEDIKSEWNGPLPGFLSVSAG
jgi:superfamily II DNA/RNA helicase